MKDQFFVFYYTTNNLYILSCNTFSSFQLLWLSEKLFIDDNLIKTLKKIEIFLWYEKSQNNLKYLSYMKNGHVKIWWKYIVSTDFSW